jgi:hypothetical protein
MKRSIVLDILNHDRCISDVSEKTGIPRKELYAWRSAHQKKINGGGSDAAAFQVVGGRPPLVNEASLTTLVEQMKDTSAFKDKTLRNVGSASNIATNVALLKAVNATATSNGFAGIATRIDPRTARRILKSARGLGGGGGACQASPAERFPRGQRHRSEGCHHSCGLCQGNVLSSGPATAR